MALDEQLEDNTPKTTRIKIIQMQIVDKYDTSVPWHKFYYVFTPATLTVGTRRKLPTNGAYPMDILVAYLTQRGIIADWISSNYFKVVNNPDAVKMAYSNELLQLRTTPSETAIDTTPINLTRPNLFAPGKSTALFRTPDYETAEVMFIGEHYLGGNGRQPQLQTDLLRHDPLTKMLGIFR